MTVDARKPAEAVSIRVDVVIGDSGRLIVALEGSELLEKHITRSYGGHGGTEKAGGAVSLASVANTKRPPDAISTAPSVEPLGRRRLRDTAVLPPFVG